MPTSPYRLLAAVSVTAAAVLGVAGPASAAPTSTGAIGGDQLTTRGVVVQPGAPALPRLSASGWLVADLDTGQVLAAKDPHGEYLPASTLKTLTALTLIPKLDPHASVEPTFADVNADGTRVGLTEGIAYPIAQLFTAMLVVSGNDAADTLATANGGIPLTVAQMNAEAQRLGALDTHAGTANGLDAAGQHSSAYDLALIARAAMQLPDFRGYVATKHSAIRGPGGKSIAISSHDKLLYNYPGAIGIKNGYTVAARASFVGAATRGGHTLVVTMMHMVPRYWPEAAALLDWGFTAEKDGVQPVGQLIDPLSTPPVAGSGGEVPKQGTPSVFHSSAAASKGAGHGVELAFTVGALLALTGLVVFRRRTSLR